MYGPLAVCILFTDLSQQTDPDPDAPAVVIKLCYNMGVPFKPNSSEGLAPFAKRFVALASGVSASIQSTTSLAASPTSVDPASLTTTTNSMPTSAESGVMPATNSSSNSGLSLGAKIGLGVAIPLVLILLAIAAFWYFRRRHHKSSSSVTADETHEVDGGQIPVEAGGQPISEMDSNTNITNSMPRPYSFEYQNPPSDSKTAFGSDIISGLSSPITSPTTASFARRTLSPTSPSPFPPPWETDQSEVAYHLLQRPLDSPSLPSPKTEIPQIQSPKTQSSKTRSSKTPSSKTPSSKTPSSKTPSPKTPSPQIQIPPPSAQITRPQNLPAMSVSRSDDAELLRLEAEIAQVREKKERLRYLSELEAREEELLRNINERRRMAASASGGPT
jgi:hypothetical protein